MTGATSSAAASVPTPQDLSSRSAGTVSALQRGLAVLDAFSGASGELGVNELSRMLGIHKSTVSRLCSTLESSGYLVRVAETNRYALGPRMTLTAVAQTPLDVRSVARPLLERLARDCGETVSLAVLRGNEVIVVDVVDGPRMVRMHTEVGMRAHVYASAAAKSILAALPDDVRALTMEKWPNVKLTPNTLTDREEFLGNVEEARKRGFSTDMEELEIGLRCVGAAVLDHSGLPVAAVSVSGPRHRMAIEVMENLGQEALMTANEISLRLGAPGSRIRSHTR